MLDDAKKAKDEEKEKDKDRTGGRSNGGNHSLQPAGDSTGAAV